MSKYPNITITFTIDTDNVLLKTQATCQDMKKSEIIMALDKLKSKIESGEFETHDDGSYYEEKIFDLP